MSQDAYLSTIGFITGDDTLRYDWFLSLDGNACEVREAYTGPEGRIEHNRNILEARARLFKDYADDHFMTRYLLVTL